MTVGRYMRRDGRVVARLRRVDDDPKVASYLARVSWVAETVGRQEIASAPGPTPGTAWAFLTLQLGEDLVPYDAETEAALASENTDDIPTV